MSVEIKCLKNFYRNNIFENYRKKYFLKISIKVSKKYITEI